MAADAGKGAGRRACGGGHELRSDPERFAAPAAGTDSGAGGTAVRSGSCIRPACTLRLCRGRSLCPGRGAHPCRCRVRCTGVRCRDAGRRPFDGSCPGAVQCRVSHRAETARHMLCAQRLCLRQLPCMAVVKRVVFCNDSRKPHRLLLFSKKIVKFISYTQKTARFFCNCRQDVQNPCTQVLPFCPGCGLKSCLPYYIINIGICKILSSHVGRAKTYRRQHR